MTLHRPLAAAAVLLALAAPAFAAGDAARGAESFKNDCAACHTVVQGGPNRVGPNLFGVLGAKAGEGRGGFHFSPAMARSGLTWDEATLIRYLQAPRRVVPGTSMSFQGVDVAAEAADIVAYLATMK